MRALPLRLLLVHILLVAATAEAQVTWPSPSELGRSALAGYIRDARPEALDEAVATGRRALAETAHRAGDREIASTMIFREGLGHRGLATLATDHDLEVIEVELKIPYEDGPHVWTASVGAVELLRFDAPLEVRLRRAIGKLRLEFLRLAYVTDGDEARQYLRVAEERDPRIFRAIVIGPAGRIAGAARDRAVLVAFPERSRAIIDGYREMQRRTDAARMGPTHEIRMEAPPGTESGSQAR